MIAAHCSYCRSVEAFRAASPCLNPMLVAWPPPCDPTRARPQDRLARLRRNGVARLNGFVVFVAADCPGDIVRARVTKVKRSHAEALRSRSSSRGAAGRRALRALSGLRRLPVPGPRVRGAARRRRPTRSPTRCAGSAGPTNRRSSRSSRPSRSSTTATSSSTRSPRRPTARRSASTGRALGRGARHRRCWLTTDLGNAIREAVRDWARASASRRTTRPSTRASCVTSSSARAGTRARRSSSS